MSKQHPGIGAISLLFYLSYFASPARRSSGSSAHSWFDTTNCTKSTSFALFLWPTSHFICTKFLLRWLKNRDKKSKNKARAFLSTEVLPSLPLDFSISNLNYLINVELIDLLFPKWYFVPKSHVRKFVKLFIRLDALASGILFLTETKLPKTTAKKTAKNEWFLK